MIVILCGKSGSGKDAIQKELVRIGFRPIISVTTRPPRDGEIDGRDYFFTSAENFEKLIADNRLIEYRSYNTLVNGVEDTWYYGVKKQDLDPLANYVVVLDVDGGQKFIDYFGLDNCLVCYVDVPDDIRRERAVKRGSFDETEWNRRLYADKQDFDDIVMHTFADVVVDNSGKLSLSVWKIIAELNKIQCGLVGGGLRNE